MKIDPIHQFNIEPLFTIGHIGNQTIAFTNSSLYMFVAVALISADAPLHLDLATQAELSGWPSASQSSMR